MSEVRKGFKVYNKLLTDELIRVHEIFTKLDDCVLIGENKCGDTHALVYEAPVYGRYILDIANSWEASWDYYHNIYFAISEVEPTDKPEFKYLLDWFIDNYITDAQHQYPKKEQLVEIHYDPDAEYWWMPPKEN